MPTPNHLRDYKKEYKRDHASKKDKLQRAARNKARLEALKKGLVSKGDNKEIDHIIPLSKGGSGSKKNTRIVKREINRRKADKIFKKIKRKLKKKKG
jgi:5-methylcytosine-specific restriction endonuclease McrA